MRHHLSHLLEWPSSERDNKCWHRFREKRTLSTVGVIASGTTTMENSTEDTLKKKLNIRVPI